MVFETILHERRSGSKIKKYFSLDTMKREGSELMRRDRLKQMHSLILEIEEEEERRYQFGAYSLLGDDRDAVKRYGGELRELAAWIDDIPDSQTRRAFRMKYVDGLPWSTVSIRMGYESLDGARKLVMRYLQKIEN